MNKLLLNSDLGEWESAGTRAAIFPHLDLANVACGGHAGSLELMNQCAELAKKHGVKTGAHPGAPGARGRGHISLESKEFTTLVEDQMSTYRKSKLELHHLKLHGSLYHLSEQDPKIRQALALIAKGAKIPVIGLAGGKVHQLFDSMGLFFLPEAFLDRNYLEDGTLVPRDSPKAKLDSIDEQKERVISIRNNAKIRTIHGEDLAIQARTICIHADHEGSAELARKFEHWSKITY